jgi:hypothetical protein
VSANITEFGRARFEHGQRLSAGDLNAAVDAELASGSCHVVGAHNTWGIVLGLDAVLRDSEVVISRGVAYDAWGRTLVVPMAARLDTPSDTAIVVARWDTGAVAIRALDPADVRPGRDIPLALIKSANELEYGVRRCARTRARPRIAAGHVTTRLAYSDTMNVREVKIDSRVGGFVGTPSYAVSTVGNFTLLPGLGPLVSIAEPGADGFTAVVRYALDPRKGAIGRQSIELHLDWLGVEARGGCQLLTPSFALLERGPA